MSTGGNKSENRLMELDALRGFAALCVLLHHYTSHYIDVYHPATPALFYFPAGYYGVYLFFMISGFVIFMTIEKTSRPLDFIVSRLSRLFPCYWVAVILTFVTVRLFDFTDREVSIKNALVNLTMLQSWFDVPYVDGVYWTLTIELSFYVLMFALLIGKRIKDVEAYGLLWLAFMVLNHTVFSMLHILVPKFILTSELLKYGHIFFAGILFYNLKTKGKTWQRYASLAACLVVHYLLRDNHQYSTQVLAVFFGVFHLLITNRLGWIANRPMIYLGTISYSLYLTHQNIGYIIIRDLYGVNANAWVRFFVPFTVALVLATLITFLVERPAMQWIRQWYIKRKARPIPQPKPAEILDDKELELSPK